MAGEKPPFSSTAWSHVYKRRADGNLIFYSVRDSLVYFTLFCTVAAKRRVRVLGLTLMYDHVHELIQSRTRKTQAAFEQEVNSLFARMWNKEAGVDGMFFEEYGFSQKRNDKHKRNVVAYLANNPVERKQCACVEDYRWNFIAYASSPNPYSLPVRSKHCSRGLERAMARVKDLHARGRWLSYPILASLTKGIPLREIQSFIDYVICTYNVIDYQAAMDLYGNYDQMLLAINANTGNEHEIQESFVGKTDAVYPKMSRYLMEKTGLAHPKSVITMTSDQKFDLLAPLQVCSGADPRQVGKYLHYKIRFVRCSEETIPALPNVDSDAALSH